MARDNRGEDEGEVYIEEMLRVEWIEGVMWNHGFATIH